MAQVKICGLTRPEDLEAAAQAGATLKLPTINASMKLPTASRQRAERIRMARWRVGIYLKS